MKKNQKRIMKNFSLKALIKNKSSLLAAIFIGFLLISIFYYRNFYQGYIKITPMVGTNDLTDLHIPFRYYLIQSLKKGQLPLWSSGISSGYPFFAEGQSGAAYPLNLLFSLFPFITSINLSLFTVYFTIFIFTFL
jgi:hypothetical protein